jgi:hypothetical protein
MGAEWRSPHRNGWQVCRRSAGTTCQLIPWSRDDHEDGGPTIQHPAAECPLHPLVRVPISICAQGAPTHARGSRAIQLLSPDEQPITVRASLVQYQHRRRPGAVWEPAVMVVPDSVERVRRILEQFAASTPGCNVEIKSASIAWHYRGAPREFAARQAHELRMLLGDLLSNQPFEVLEGKKVIGEKLRDRLSA